MKKGKKAIKSRFDDGAILRWLTHQMAQDGSGGAIAEVARLVKQGYALGNVVQHVRLARLKHALRIWGQWRQIPYTGYAPMDTLGRVQEYGVGGSPNFRSKPPIIRRYTDIALERMDEKVSQLCKRDPEAGQILCTHYTKPEQIENQCQELGITQSTWYRRVERGHEILLEEIA